MTIMRRIRIPVAVGLVAALLMTAFYFGIVSWAESFQHALDLFWQDRMVVFPIILGFGVQAALFTILKMRLFISVTNVGPSGALTGAGGATSTMAMAACCAHHVADVLPFLGLTAAATFLANYRVVFMWLGLGTTVTGIIIMLVILIKARRMAMRHFKFTTEKA